MEDRLWTVKDVCRYLGVSSQTVHRWRAEQLTPQALEFGSVLRWVPAQVREWALSLAERGDVVTAGHRSDVAAGLRSYSSKGDGQ